MTIERECTGTCLNLSMRGWAHYTLYMSHCDHFITSPGASIQRLGIGVVHIDIYIYLYINLNAITHMYDVYSIIYI